MPCCSGGLWGGRGKKTDPRGYCITPYTTLTMFSLLERDLRGHLILFLPLEGTQEITIKFSPLSANWQSTWYVSFPGKVAPWWHFITFSPVMGHPRGHLIIFLPSLNSTWSCFLPQEDSLERTLSHFLHWRAIPGGSHTSSPTRTCFHVLHTKGNSGEKTPNLSPEFNQTLTHLWVTWLM